MLETSEKLIEATNNMNGCVKAQMMKEMDLEAITPETLALIQSYLKFVEVSNEYIEEVSRMIDKIDDKLSELLTIAREP